jgi:hypothetical protein
LAVVAALGDVMGTSDRDGSGQSGHNAHSTAQSHLAPSQENNRWLSLFPVPISPEQGGEHL